MTDEAMIASERYDADFRRRIADIERRLKAVEDRVKAKRALAPTKTISPR